MSERKDTGWGRAWYVLLPLALILTGVGWLAIGLALGSQAQAHHVRGRAVVARNRARAASRPRQQAAAIRAPRLANWVVHPVTGHSYNVVDAPTWKAAQARAAELGGQLVTIDSAVEQDWLVSTFGGAEPFWIGLTDADSEGAWRWADGAPASYTNWAPYEPNNMFRAGEHLGVMNWWGLPGKWNDMNPASARKAGVIAAIIERRPEVQRAAPVRNAGASDPVEITIQLSDDHAARVR